ncbi:MAG: enoyl-CoA hydratase/isomerase family protein, partial [Microbacteriaceae bacterium]|nr:enoyl-CoA hydratase/isomerase family protein [Microbacteriaceae bacterium]
MAKTSSITAQYDGIDFAALAAEAVEDVPTRSYVRDVTLGSGRRIALVTLDNGKDHNRPNTLGPGTMLELGAVIEALAARATAGEIDAVAFTGKPYILAAGADLTQIENLTSREQALRIAQLGHLVYGRIRELSVPTFCFINGLALGGGLELALAADYRTVDSSAAALAFPEVFLGIIPGWGGATLLPNLIGVENALKVIVSNAVRQNRMLRPAEANELGISDAIFPPVNFLEDSLRWADAVIGGEIKVKRPNEPGTIERTVKWPIAASVARKQLAESAIGTVPLAPYRAVDLIAAAKDGDVAKGFAREDEALADLISGDQFRASIYAFNLVQKRGKRPVGAPDKALAQKVNKVGIIGAGLMAQQFALLFVRRLQVPVVITDLDQARIDKGVAYIHDELDKLAAKGRLVSDDLNKLKGLVTGTTEKTAFADCDWVIEAVFEEVGVKQQVFADIEQHVREDAILATNTSSLLVDEIGAKLQHPERLVGFHFFNPVAVMPLVEVVNAPKTSEAALATAVAVAGKLKKTAIITGDGTGFIVNRLLTRLFSDAMEAVERGTSFETVVEAQQPFGFPMDPFALLDLVGLKVGQHVLDTHAAAFPDRYQASAALAELADTGALVDKDAKGNVTGISKLAREIVAKHRIPGSKPFTAVELRRKIEDGLA